MKTVCAKDMCTGCMACVDICRKGAITVSRGGRSYNAYINSDTCVSCNSCVNVCQNKTIPEFHEPNNWYQGWANERLIRKGSASGGFATAISKMFLDKKGVVFCCKFENGDWTFDEVSKTEDISLYSGSKYVKSNPTGIYKRIKQRLKDNVQVLFIGLPCQVAALKNYLGNDKCTERLYTIDLICHGTPAPILLERYLETKNLHINDIKGVVFRKKEANENDDLYPLSKKGVRDLYSLAFLNSLIFTENCYSCQFAQMNRVSDLTLGDSWGSEMIDEMNSGISLALCQSPKGEELLEKADISLFDVDKTRAVDANHQLCYPCEKPKEREAFFAGLEEGKKFQTLVWKTYPKQCLTQKIKSILYCAGIRKKNDIDYGLSVKL